MSDLAESADPSVAPRSGRKKMLLRLVLLGLVGALGLVVLGGFGNLLSAVTSSGETAEVFTDAAELSDELLDAVTWLPDDENLPRPMEPLTRVDVTSAWIRAWSQLTVAAETGETAGMEVYFSNDALRAVLAGAENATGRPVFQIGHDLQLTFYSEDGQVIGLTSERSRMLRAEPFDDGRRRFFETEESYEAVLVLEDGNWRIHHWVRRAISGKWLVGDGLPATSDVLSIAEAEEIYELRIDGLISDGSGEMSLSGDVLPSGDAAALRVPIGFAESGGATLSAEALKALQMALGEASDRGSSVVLSLFDGRTDFSPSRWHNDRLHIDAIRDVVRQSEALVSVEIGFAESLDSDLAKAWLVSMSGDGGDGGSQSNAPLSVGGQDDS